MRRSLFCGIAILSIANAAAAQHQHPTPAKSAAKAPQEQATSGHHAGHHVTKAAVIRVTDDPATHTMTMRVGMLNLPANTDHTAATQLSDAIWEVPFDGWLTAYHPRLTNAQGATVPGRLLHHVAFWNASRSDFLCPNKEEHIFGAGGEMNDWPALPGFGYRVRKGDRIRVNTMFHNPTATNYPQVWIEVKMEYLPANAATAAQIKSVYPTWFDVQRCGDSGYDLAAGPQDWPQQREAFGDAVIDTLAEYAPNIRECIRHRQVLTPWDLEQEFGLGEGNIFHGELSLEQLLFLRPAACWTRYRTPLPGLWMCGSGTHPGGGIMGAPGELCAKMVLARH